MSLFSDMISASVKHERIWAALADPTRRAILDLLRETPRTTGEVCSAFKERLSRVGVMKHLDVLTGAGLVVARRKGRNRWNHLNPEPLREVCMPWIERYQAAQLSALEALKTHVEANEQPDKKETQNG